MSVAPKVLKIMQILGKAENLLSSYEPKPYGGGNPYYYCSECQRSMIEVSTQGHHSGCIVPKIEQKVRSLRGQVDHELKIFLESKEYLSKSYKNYLWFKSGRYVSCLDQLTRDIRDFIK